MGLDEILPPWLIVEKDSLLLKIIVAPGASRTKIIGEYDGQIKIAIASPPVDGKANKTLIEFLSELLKVPKSRLAIGRGATGRKKTVHVPQEYQQQILAVMKNTDS